MFKLPAELLVTCVVQLVQLLYMGPRSGLNFPAGQGSQPVMPSGQVKEET